MGNAMTLRATVNAAWRTSMEVGVRMESKNPRVGDITHGRSTVGGVTSRVERMRRSSDR